MTPPRSSAAGQAATHDAQPRPSERAFPRRERHSGVPPSPRRVSGPAVSSGTRPATAPRPPHAPRLRPVPAGEDRASLRSGVVAFLLSLPDRRIIDRLVRGRAWIPVLGVMLAGIVAMQVEVLKLNASTGRAVQQATSLFAEHQRLQADYARESDDHRIEALAAKDGLVMAPPGSVGFLRGDSGSAAQAAAHIQVPNAARFLAASSSNGQVATAPTTTTPGGEPSAGASAGANAGATTAAGTGATPGGAATAAGGTGAATAGASAAGQSAATPGQ